ncbi:unnamed protein product [Staurois parvus]|uniref:Uncharacterized protein n=1 Tax=Staurois parvus TaxID=386267 RepID=A0ABN9AJC3_9NEOB|nr:unnamed protein product [Staurois parvus]
MGPPGNRDHGARVLAHTQSTPKKAYKKVTGAFHGAPYHGRTDYLETRALPEGPGSVGGPI